MVLSATDHPAADSERLRILDAAERLFYAHGLQLVGMDQVRGAAGVSLKRLYREFPSKDQLIEAYLLRRDARWLTSLRTATAAPATPAERILAAFDWLGEWFAEPGFRGCAFTNSFGELGAESSTVAAIAAAHKAEFRSVFVDLARLHAAEHSDPVGAGDSELGEYLYLLAEGAITAAAVTGDRGSAASARAAAAVLLTRSSASDSRQPTRPADASRDLPAVRRIGARLVGNAPWRLLRRRR
ncbi:MAG TPA: helix-turn-helix domain-containing protein [Pseudonocardia sp.]|nr:helix-turn-helix domain-containing protein [Pseudonocardia sp.]